VVGTQCGHTNDLVEIGKPQSLDGDTPLALSVPEAVAPVAAAERVVVEQAVGSGQYFVVQPEMMCKMPFAPTVVCKSGHEKQGCLLKWMNSY